ncbi:unnamed protein product, partial [Iphiclides podalirius]
MSVLSGLNKADFKTASDGLLELSEERLRSIMRSEPITDVYHVEQTPFASLPLFQSNNGVGAKRLSETHNHSAIGRYISRNGRDPCGGDFTASPGAARFPGSRRDSGFFPSAARCPDACAPPTFYGRAGAAFSLSRRRRTAECGRTSDLECRLPALAALRPVAHRSRLFCTRARGNILTEAMRAKPPPTISHWL